jgi:NAD(P)H-dependent FMN reductase
MHPGTAHLLQFFRYDHLPAPLQAASKPFSDLAHAVADAADNPETTAALRKLLEAKDCAVRAVLAK